MTPCRLQADEVDCKEIQTRGEPRERHSHPDHKGYWPNPVVGSRWRWWKTKGKREWPQLSSSCPSRPWNMSLKALKETKNSTGVSSRGELRSTCPVESSEESESELAIGTSHHLALAGLNGREGKPVAPHLSALTFRPSKLHSKSSYSGMAGNCKSAEGGTPPNLQSPQSHSSNPPHDSQPPRPNSLPPPPTKPPPQQLQPLFISQETLGRVGGSEEEVPRFPPIIPGFIARDLTFGG